MSLPPHSRLVVMNIVGEGSHEAWGIKFAKHRSMTRARVAVARKLATIPHRMWIDKSDFSFGREQLAAHIK
jgi:hypothetical protein